MPQRSITLFITISIVFTVSYCVKLNFPRILLPYNVDKPSNMVIEVSDVSRGDCFEWLSTEPHHVTVSPVDTTAEHNCSTKAIASAIHSSPEKHTSYILAVQKGSPSNYVACEVITDSISSIGLTYFTTNIFLEGPPEIITVTGKNKEGHSFNSLNGMEFEWSSSISDSTSDDEDIIRFVKFSDSPYASPTGILDWEKQDRQSSSVLIESVNIGSATVFAKLKHPIYSDVKEDRVTLKVVTNVRLNHPYDLYLLRGSSVLYKAEAIKQGRATEIQCEPYNVKVRNSEIVSVDEHGLVTALKAGSTTVFTEDTYNKSVIHSSAIHVVEPSYMVLDVFPGKSWALKEVKNYEVSVKLYDSNHHQMYLPPNLRMRVSFPNKLFYINSSTPNGTHHVVRTIVPGTGTIRAELKSLENADGTLMKVPSISTYQKVVIYQSVQIMPPFVMVPWDNISRPEYVVHLKAGGGTGVYVWSANDVSIADVKYQPEESSQAVVHIHGVGDVVITATDRHNPGFFSTMKLSAQPVLEVEVNPTVVEGSVGNHIIIPVALLGYENKEKKVFRVFDDCSKMNLSVDVVNKNRINFIPDADVPSFGRGCVSLQFLCRFPGHSRVNIECRGMDGPVKTTLVLACHKPVKPVNPVRVAVLALGTSKEVVFEGGPRAWPMFTEGYYSRLIASESELVDISEIKDPVRYNRDLHVFEVLCKKLGETMLTFQVGNKESPTNKSPAKLESSVKVICGEPATLHLKVQSKSESGKKEDENPTDPAVVKVPFYGNKVFEVNLGVKDAIGRKFGNISSFSVYWEVSDYTLAKPQNYRDFITYADGSAGYQKISRNFQEFQMTGKTGPLKVTAKLLGYRKDVLDKLYISSSAQLKEISQHIDLSLVSLREVYDGYSFLNQGEEEAQKDTCDGDTCHS